MLPCSVCGKSFDRPSLLKRHMRTSPPHVIWIAPLCCLHKITPLFKNYFKRIPLNNIETFDFISQHLSSLSKKWQKKIQFPGMGCFSSVEITCSRGWQPACNKDNVTFSLILQDNSQKGMVGKYKYTQIYFPSTWLRAPPEGFFLNFFKPS